MAAINSVVTSPSIKADVNLVSIGNYANDNAISLGNLVDRLRELRCKLDGSTQSVEAACGDKTPEVKGLLAVINDANIIASGHLTDLERELNLLAELL